MPLLPARLPLGAALVAVLVSGGILVSPGVAAASADLSIIKIDSFDPRVAGFDVGYMIQVINSGPDAADDVSWSDTLPAPTTFLSLAAPAGWSCTTPPVGSGGTVSCSIASLPVSSAIFTLVAGIPADTPQDTVFSNTVTVSSTTSDPDNDDLSATESTTVRTVANLSASKVGVPDPVAPGTNLTYTITVRNGGPSHAADAVMSDPIPPGTTFVSLAAPAGWSCSTPPVGAGGPLECSIASLPPGTVAFTLVVKVDSDVIPGSRIENRGQIVSKTPADVPFGSPFSTGTTVGGLIADISLTKTGSPDPVDAGADISYTLTVGNAGPSNAPSATVSDTLPAGTTFVSLSSPPGWSCVTPDVGAGGTVSCTHGSFGVGNDVFTLVVQVDPATAAGTVISNGASLTMLAASDPNPGDTHATADTTVSSAAAAAAITGTKTVSGTLEPGSLLAYTVVLSNNGSSAQADNPGHEFTDVLPAGSTLVDATATSGTVVANVGTNTVTWNGSIAAGGSVTLTITATLDAPLGTTISNQGTITYDADGNGTNEASRSTDDPNSRGAEDPTTVVVGALIATIPALDWRGLMALAALLAALGIGWLRRG